MDNTAEKNREEPSDIRHLLKIHKHKEKKYHFTMFQKCLKKKYVNLKVTGTLRFTTP